MGKEKWTENVLFSVPCTSADDVGGFWGSYFHCGTLQNVNRDKMSTKTLLPSCELRGICTWTTRISGAGVIGNLKYVFVSVFLFSLLKLLFLLNVFNH